MVMLEKSEGIRGGDGLESPTEPIVIHLSDHSHEIRQVDYELFSPVAKSSDGRVLSRSPSRKRCLDHRLLEGRSDGVQTVGELRSVRRQRGAVGKGSVSVDDATE